MNPNFNTPFEKLLPYIFAIVLAYIVTTVIFLLLPKNGVELTQLSNPNTFYKKYDGFYSQGELTSDDKMNEPTIEETLDTIDQYKLKAIYATISNGGWITIEDKETNESFIMAQYENFNGYTLTKLFTSYVVFEQDATEYKLQLPLDKDTSTHTISSSISTLDQNITRYDDRISINRVYLNQYLNDSENIKRDIRFKDIREDGMIEGFIIDHVTQNSLFEKLGLEQNDQILSVNAQEILSYADLYSLLEQIDSIDFITLEILRESELLELNYEID